MKSFRVDLAVALILSSIACAAWAFTQREAAVVRDEADQRRAVSLSRDSVSIVLEVTKAQLTAHARVIVEDPRLLVALGRSDMDDATLLDMLEDMGRVLHRDLALLRPDGVVRASTGAARWEGGLGSSALVKAVQKSGEAQAAVWSNGSSVVVVAVDEVTIGAKKLGLVVVAEPLVSPAFERAANLAGVHAALVVDGEVTGVGAAVTDGLRVAAKVAWNRTAQTEAALVDVQGARLATTSIDLSEGPREARLVLAYETPDTSSRSLWIPAVVVLLLLTFLAFRSVILPRQ